MKVHEKLIDEVKKISSLGIVLDIGFSYPYELIELYHLYNARKCIGVDLKRIEDSVSCSLIVNEISKTTEIDRQKISNLIRDEDSKREFHNSYKTYTSLVLNTNPLDFEYFENEIELHYSKSIQDYLNNDNKWIPEYDVIIASKVLSHINPDSNENGDWVLESLIGKLSSKGILYLRLNSDDFKVEENRGIPDSTILEPFNKIRLDKVLDKLDVLYQETIKRDDGKREYIIIGNKKQKRPVTHDDDGIPCGIRHISQFRYSQYEN